MVSYANSDCSFLGSDYASFITGTCMEITGGKFCVQNPSDAWT